MSEKPQMSGVKSVIHSSLCSSIHPPIHPVQWVSSLYHALKVKVQSVSHSVASDPLPPHGLSPTRLLCPWDSPGKNTGVEKKKKRILEWVAIPFLRVSSWPRNRTRVFCIAGSFFTIWASREALYHAWGARITSLSLFGDQLFGNSVSKFVQVFVGHQLFWAEPFAEHCGEHRSAKGILSTLIQRMI